MKKSKEPEQIKFTVRKIMSQIISKSDKRKNKKMTKKRGAK
jgi:hypothetical protein